MPHHIGPDKKPRRNLALESRFRQPGFGTRPQWWRSMMADDRLPGEVDIDPEDLQAPENPYIDPAKYWETVGRIGFGETEADVALNVFPFGPALGGLSRAGRALFRGAKKIFGKTPPARSVSGEVGTFTNAPLPETGMDYLEDRLPYMSGEEEDIQRGLYQEYLRRHAEATQGPGPSGEVGDPVGYFRGNQDDAREILDNLKDLGTVPDDVQSLEEALRRGFISGNDAFDIRNALGQFNRSGMALYDDAAVSDLRTAIQNQDWADVDEILMNSFSGRAGPFSYPMMEEIMPGFSDEFRRYFREFEGRFGYDMSIGDDVYSDQLTPGAFLQNLFDNRRDPPMYFDEGPYLPSPEQPAGLLPEKAGASYSELADMLTGFQGNKQETVDKIREAIANLPANAGFKHLDDIYDMIGNAHTRYGLGEGEGSMLGGEASDAYNAIQKKLGPVQHGPEYGDVPVEDALQGQQEDFFEMLRSQLGPSAGGPTFETGEAQDIFNEIQELLPSFDNMNRQEMFDAITEMQKQISQVSQMGFLSQTDAQQLLGYTDQLLEGKVPEGFGIRHTRMPNDFAEEATAYTQDIASGQNLISESPFKSMFSGIEGAAQKQAPVKVYDDYSDQVREALDAGKNIIDITNDFTSGLSVGPNPGTVGSIQAMTLGMRAADLMKEGVSRATGFIDNVDQVLDATRQSPDPESGAGTFMRTLGEELLSHGTQESETVLLSLISRVNTRGPLLKEFFPYMDTAEHDRLADVIEKAFSGEIGDRQSLDLINLIPEQFRKSRDPNHRFLIPE